MTKNKEIDLNDPVFIEYYRDLQREKQLTPFDVLAAKEQDEKIRAAFQSLTPREQRILGERFEGKTLKNLAGEFGFSIERVRQIQAKAERNMRQKLRGLKLK